jgi:AraC family transcriptional regulator
MKRVMNPVEKAIWFVEAKFEQDISLDEVAGVAGVSRYHMARVFAEATGHSVMRYARGRRLTEAARALAAGAPDILSVALDAGYSSHEAFTRAFRDQFGITPEHLRAARQLDSIQLVEPIRMDTTPATLAAPRFETGKALLIAGLGARYTSQNSQAIPSQWQRFGPHIGHIPGQVGITAYGVCCNFDEDGTFEYIAGVEVARFADLPESFRTLRVPERRYAVFSHREHISAIRATHFAIWSKWLPESGHEVADAPNFERYGPEFDPQTGTGLVEIWVPLKG